MRLHRAAQVVQNVGHALAGIRRVEPREARAGGLARLLRQVAVRLRLRVDVLEHLLARGLAEHQQVEQRVGAEAVGAVHRYAGAFAGGEQARDDRLLARALGRHHLPHVIRRDAAHLIMHRRRHRDRIADRVGVGELDRDLADPRQPMLDQFRAEMIELEQQVVALGTAAAALLDLGDHSARHHVAARQVLGVRRVALHEALAVLVDQIAALAAHALGDEHPGARHAAGVELPELHVLQRQPGAGGHSQAVAGVDESVGREQVDTAGAAGRQEHRFRLQQIELAALHLEGRDADDGAVLRVAHQVECHPFDEELRVGAHVLLVQRVQHRVPGAIGRRAGAHRHLRAAVVLRVAAERALIDLAVLEAVEGHAHVLELDHHLDGAAAHVFDRVLVAEVVGALDRVVHVPVPVVLGRIGERRGDSALCCHGVRARREDLREHRDLELLARELQRGAHARASRSDHDRVEFADRDHRQRTCTAQPR